MPESWLENELQVVFRNRMPNKSVNFWINVPIETLSTKLETNDQCDYIGLVWKVYVKKFLQM